MKPSRDDVLRVAGECGITFESGRDYEIAFDIEIEQFAAAMYAAGAEGMRERAIKVCGDLEDDYLSGGQVSEWDTTEAAAASGACANLIRALPITPTNTEGEQ